MDIEFHYYVTYLLARKAGMNKTDTQTIAYASQYVDDNTIIFNINKGKVDAYTNYISQTMDITKPKNILMRIYPLFHFIPGDPLAGTARRRDGILHLLNTTPDSTLANRLLDEALQKKNLYRIGIAVHSYMDTWAHQNFIGCCAKFNSMTGVREKLTPDIGHADAVHHPDIPGLIWRDRRLARDIRAISNNARFLEASEKVFKKFVACTDKNAKKKDVQNVWKKVRREIEKAIGKEFTHDREGRKQRIKRYRKIMPEISEYKPDMWFKQAVNTKAKGLPDEWAIIKIFPDHHMWKKNYRKSHWYNFQEAVMEHQDFAESECADIFEQIELENY